MDGKELVLAIQDKVGLQDELRMVVVRSGQYLLNFGSSVAGKPILASGGYANDQGDQRGETTAGPCNGGTDGINCSSSNNSNTVFVETRTSAGIPGDHAFYIAVFG